MLFENVNISNEIRRAVQDMGFVDPTPIQEKGIPLVLEGNDVIGQSHTGTGKTAAFAIPILEKIDKEDKRPQVLILCPTRELSVQVCEEIRKIAKYLGNVRIQAVYGGEPIYKQINALKRGAQIIVGTPGRTIDHIRRKTIRVNAINTIVLDEADEMLKMGFREDIETVLQQIDEDRQTILFSATMPQSIIDITKKYQKNPKIIRIKSKEATTDTIDQQYCRVKEKHKTDTVCRLLDTEQPHRCIVFCNTKNKVNDVTDELQARGFDVEKIHGDLKQELRLNVLRKFHEGIIEVLIATDVAARGLDVQDVELIINYDVPDKEEYYVHRIGRSGRAGKSGRSITLVSKSEIRRFYNIEGYIRKKIDRMDIPTIAEVHEKKSEVIVDEVGRIISDTDLNQYKKMIPKVLDKGYQLEDVAAALLKKVLELDEDVEQSDLNERGTDRRRNGREEGKRGRQKSSKGMARLFINTGKKHKLSVGDILGAITGECGVQGKHIGTIDMFDKFSFIEIDEDYEKKVLKKLQNKRIKGRKVNIEVANKR